MIITRTPLRISIGGGGTDLPSYYSRRGGMVISAAINRYVYLACNRTFTDDYFLKYSDIERVQRVDEIRHPIIREALKLHPVGPGLEVVSLADIPAGTGLGSSGSFTVGLLRALRALERNPALTSDLAEEACHIEIDRLGEPVGKQDQYIAAYGGLTRFDFDTEGRVTASPLAVTEECLCELEERLMLFFTGYSRRASAMLADQKQRSEHDDDAMIANLDRTRALGEEIATALEGGDTHAFGELMHRHWIAKRGRTAGMSNDDIDAWYELALENGAVGGKLVGAGAGGFLLCYTTSPTRLRKALTGAGLTEVRFRFDHEGSVLQSTG